MRVIRGISMVLVIIGGLDWGIIGIGDVIGHPGWNVIHKVLMSVPSLETLLYLLIGIGAIILIIAPRHHS